MGAEDHRRQAGQESIAIAIVTVSDLSEATLDGMMAPGFIVE